MAEALLFWLLVFTHGLVTGLLMAVGLRSVGRDLRTLYRLVLREPWHRPP